MPAAGLALAGEEQSEAVIRAHARCLIQRMRDAVRERAAKNIRS
ncbi:hypothetical protein GLE_4676 [Lysobacter enzymogenes]|uniref:Uncharacterized protein n=1 Tax=Lysobacter enzymogenes TaxID=69 RepID=A0A0S2DNG3_LYSEN|nr:hypothetical protein GLE_4676 [Lysobacter enzymogenes]